MFCFFDNKINDNNVKLQDDKLFKKYGKCKQLMTNIKILVITDTHGFLSYNDANKFQLTKYNENDYDICCCLGDITYSDFDFILQYVPQEKILAILGNHDEFNILKYYNLFDINGKSVTINGIKFGGIQGSWKYKDEKFPSYTHKESIDLLNKLGYVDILLSHTGPFWNYNQNLVHNVLKGITEYLYKNKVPYNIHGHNHVSKDLYLKNGTHIKECYMIELLNLN